MIIRRLKVAADAKTGGKFKFRFKQKPTDQKQVDASPCSAFRVVKRASNSKPTNQPSNRVKNETAAKDNQTEIGVHWLMGEN